MNVLLHVQSLRLSAIKSDSIDSAAVEVGRNFFSRFFRCFISLNLLCRRLPLFSSGYGCCLSIFLSHKIDWLQIFVIRFFIALNYEVKHIHVASNIKSKAQYIASLACPIEFICFNRFFSLCFWLRIDRDFYAL